MEFDWVESCISAVNWIKEWQDMDAAKNALERTLQQTLQVFQAIAS
jgi:hypothetical protein